MKKPHGKSLLYILPIAILSLGSIGFASYKGWKINPEAEASFTIGADSVREFNQRFIGSGISSSTAFTEEGIVTTNTVNGNTVRYVDTENDALPSYSVSFGFLFKAESGKSVSSYLPTDATGFTLRAVLTEDTSGFSLFSLAKVASANLIYGSSSATGTKNDESDKASDWSFDLSNFGETNLSSNSVNFSVTFAISFSITRSEWKANVYDRLSNGAFAFSLMVGGIF